MKEYSIKIIIATHKKYQMPSDDMYIPLHVGADGKKDAEGNDLDFGYIKDNTGDNISNLNPSFCELTGLYWAWKNLSEDYIGLVHYRRHFAMNGRTLEFEQIKPYLGRIRIFTPKKRWYVIETLKSHYRHTHYPEHLEIARAVAIRKYPEYKKVFDKTLNRRWGYMFNMIIMDRRDLNDYCAWLFDVLFDIYDQIDCSKYSAFEKRYVGRISELLFNVWLEYALESGRINKNEIMELAFDVEENLVVKIPAFLKAKFLGKKYRSSF